MGIKGIYGEIGPGERIALSKLAIEKYEETGRPLRIAVDVSIWQFQIQAGQGGSNPAIRTLYYRLLRLLSASVQPLFVFDGPRKPTFKRNKRSGHNAGSLSNVLTKQLLKLFGFPFHIAPGEAEAECALLQREGIVDAVLSEDVDTLMFGCGITLRNWSSEGSKGNHSPTHVSLYDAQVTKIGESGLDREGMILIAMMSGGDYTTEGIPGCGIKVACQAARAGFGKSLCRISRSDAAGFEAWKKNLTREIQTNESRYFKTKHKALKIPDSFPNMEVLGFYTHPIVSSASKIKKLKEDIVWGAEIDVPGLRLFVAETFEWVNKAGANKFIRGLAPALLVHKLLLRGNRRESGFGDVILTAMNEMELVRAICGKRIHASTDGTPELRVIYHPVDIVGLDLDAEEDGSEDYGRDGLAPVNDDDEIEAYASNPPPASTGSSSPSKLAASTYDPTKPEKLWLLETVAKIGIPLKVEDYEESLRDPKKFIAAKFSVKRAAAKSGMPKGAMENFLKVTKPSAGLMTQNALKISNKPLGVSSLAISPSDAHVETVLSSQSAPVPRRTSSRSARSTRSSALTNTESAAAKPKTNIKTKRQALAEKPDKNTNPWTLTQSSHTCDNLVTTKALGQPTKSSSPKVPKHSSYIDLSSSTNTSPSCLVLPIPNSPQKHAHSPQRDTTVIEENDCQLISTSTDVDMPSPKKRRSLESPFKATSPQLPRLSRDRAQPLTPEPVNRKIDFQASTSRASPSPTAFPSLQDLFSTLPPSEPAPLKDTSTIEFELPVRCKNPIEHEGNTPHRRREMEITTITSSPPNPPSPVPTSPLRTWPSSDDENKKPQRGNVVRGGKKYLMLRDSLPGTWKEVDESMIGTARSRAWRQSEVEILDMTAD